MKEQNAIPFPDELTHLNQTMQIIDTALTEAKEDVRKLDYIACTRAMHKLTLFYTESPSPFLPNRMRDVSGLYKGIPVT